MKTFNEILESKIKSHNDDLYAGFEIGPFSHRELNVFNKAAAEYANQFKEANQWVSVDERMPEQYADVLFYIENGDQRQGFINSSGQLMLGRQGMFAYRFEFSNDLSEKITHWQPLPSPPQQQSKEAGDSDPEEVMV